MSNNYIFQEESKQKRGIDKTGQLLLKDKLDSLEYYLYNSKMVESIDLNAKFESYYTDKQEIYISIKQEGEVLFEDKGKLKKVKLHGVNKYILNETDLEMLLFDLVDKTINIKIKIIHEAEFGGMTVDDTGKKS